MPGPYQILYQIPSWSTNNSSSKQFSHYHHLIMLMRFDSFAFFWGGEGEAWTWSQYNYKDSWKDGIIPDYTALLFRSSSSYRCCSLSGTLLWNPAWCSAWFVLNCQSDLIVCSDRGCTEGVWEADIRHWRWAGQNGKQLEAPTPHHYDLNPPARANLI